MTELRIDDLPAALADRRHPTVGVWNRLEGRPRTTDFARALRAEVRDPLWMLSRQWQLGEFQGSDAGSPVTATYSVATGTPGRFSPGDGPGEPLPGDRPLETVAERRPVPFAFGAEPIAFDLRLALGRRWLRYLQTAITLPLVDFRSQYIAKYPIAVPDPASVDDIAQVAHPETWAAMQAVAGRQMDGYLLYQHIVGGGHASDGINDPLHLHRAALDGLGTKLRAWFDALIDQPDHDSAWDPRRLEHRFAISAAGPGASGAVEKVLTAPEYPGGELDWHAFSVGSGTLGGSNPAPATINRTVFPSPVTFSGMPLPRWWALEDGRTNFAAVSPDSTDLARLIFLEFALVYSNDWVQLPCDLPTGTLATIQGLAVTDVFGQRRWITPGGTGSGQSWQRWSMFSLDPVTDAPATGPGSGLLLPPGVPKVSTGPAVESVMLVRDENANLVWGIEQTVPVATGEGRRGEEVAAETRAHRRRLHPGQPTDDEPRAAVAYEIMSSTPENWIPFIPVHVPDSDDHRTVQLQRAALPSEVDGTTAIRPRTSLLRGGLDTDDAYFINEEEVPRAGTTVTLAYNRTRWRDGRPIVWLSAHRGVGRGERSSGLGFDLLVPPPA